MATRRMFSKTIIDSDEFLEMPVSARLLYFDLGMRADDDGFVNPKRILKMTGAAEDDLKVLLAKKYVLNFENKVLVIRDWKVNNFIRPDRYTPTIYQEYLKRLQITDSNQYELPHGIPDDIPDDIPVVDAGKVRLELGKDRLLPDFSEKNQEEVTVPLQEDSQEDIEESRSVPDEDTILTKQLLRQTAVEGGYKGHLTRPILEWAEGRIGKKFVNVPKQKKFIAGMLDSGYSENDIKVCWELLEKDNYWCQKGFDFAIVADQISKFKTRRKIANI